MTAVDQAQKGVKVILRNSGKGSRAVFDVRRQSVLVPPGGTQEAVLTEHMFGLLQRMDGDLSAERVGFAPAPAKAPNPSGPGAQPVQKSGKLVIPDDWESQDWNYLRSLATRLGKGKITCKADAFKAIRSYLAENE